MKIPLAMSALILAIGAALVWHDHQKLSAVRETHARLVAEAGLLGIPIVPARPSDAVRVTKRGERGKKEEMVEEIVRDIIANAKEVENLKTQGKQPDEAMRKRGNESVVRIADLDAAQIKLLIASLESSTGLSEERRRDLIDFSLKNLADKHPQAALAILTKSQESMDGNRDLVSSALSRWAKDDPLGALAWLKTNGGKFPDLITEDAKKALVVGAAGHDPILAFKLVGELGLTGKSRAVSSIMSAATTPEERTAAFTALRDYLAGINDENARAKASHDALWELKGRVVSGGFESATRWIEKTQLTPDELVSFASGLTRNIKSSETGRWIEWLNEKLPAEKSRGVIRNMVFEWTRSDFEAAGVWLNTVPAGPLKNSAIRSFAETVSPFEPEAAAQWALTLPAGEDRDKTLKGIYENWPKKDDASKAAAEAFKSRHGVK